MSAARFQVSCKHSYGIVTYLLHLGSASNVICVKSACIISFGGGVPIIISKLCPGQWTIECDLRQADGLSWKRLLGQLVKLKFLLCSRFLQNLLCKRSLLVCAFGAIIFFRGCEKMVGFQF